MEKIEVLLDDGTGRAFDAALQGTLPEAGDLCIITKDRATEGGNPGALLTFTVGLPDGKFARAQAVATVKNLILALDVLRVKYEGFGPLDLSRRMAQICEIIEGVEGRCMAVDGPVTPTLKEMTEKELRQIYRLAKGVK